jgi:hypothetical protein
MRFRKQLYHRHSDRSKQKVTTKTPQPAEQAIAPDVAQISVCDWQEPQTEVCATSAKAVARSAGWHDLWTTNLGLRYASPQGGGARLYAIACSAGWKSLWALDFWTVFDANFDQADSQSSGGDLACL